MLKSNAPMEDTMDKIFHAIERANRNSNDNVKEIAVGSDAFNRLYALFANLGVTVRKDKEAMIFGIPILNDSCLNPNDVEIRLGSGFAYLGIFSDIGWVMTHQAFLSREDYAQYLRRRVIEKSLFPIGIRSEFDA